MQCHIYKNSHMWLCCTNPLKDSSQKSRVIAGVVEHTEHVEIQDPELCILQYVAQAPWPANDLVQIQTCRGGRSLQASGDDGPFIVTPPSRPA